MSEDGEKLRIGICGIGSIGLRHARLLSQRGGVALYLCDSAGAHLESAAGLANLRRATESFEELLESSLDGIIIATPDHLHISQAVAACRTGAAVLIEKPLAENAQQAANLQQCVDENNYRVLIGYPLRYNGVFLKGKELLDAAAIGAPVSFHIMLGAYNTLVAAKNRFDRAEENKLFIDYSHEWDYLHWFLGKAKRVAAISRQAGELERTQKPNVVDCLFEMETGITGTAHLDYVQAPGERQFTVIGDKGALTIDFVRSKITVRVYKDDFERTFRLTESFDVMMTRQHDHFIEIVRGERQTPRVTIEDGLNALRTAAALIASCETGGWQPVQYNDVQ